MNNIIIVSIFEYWLFICIVFFAINSFQSHYSGLSFSDRVYDVAAAAGQTQTFPLNAL